MESVMDQELLSGEFLDTLYRHFPVMLMVIDRNGTLQSVNPAFTSRFGRTPDEMRTLPDPLLPLSPEPDVREELWNFLLRAEPRTWKQIAAAKDSGGESDTSWTSTRLPEGTIVAIGIDSAAKNPEDTRADQRTTRNLTRRTRQLQHLAMELTRAEQRERNLLARTLHDDLQQVLVCANYSLSLLKGRLRNDPAGHSLAEEVGRIINEAVTASRALSSELNPPILTKGNLVEVLEWLIREARRKHEIDVRFRDIGGPGSPEPPEAVKLLLFHAVRELLLNALRHANARQIVVTLERKESGVGVTVEDDGIGFDPASLDAWDDRESESTGIGLFGIRERLDLFGGILKIESKPGSGSRIILLVPDIRSEYGVRMPGLSAVRPSLAGKLPPAAEPPRPVVKDERITVLLADDHRMVRKGLVALLSEQEDIRVVGEAGDGEEALRLALELRPAVVVLDVEMPRMDGVEATRRIREFLPDTRIIGLSMIEEPEMAARMVSAGATCYLSKAGPTDFLLQAIREDFLIDDISPTAADVSPTDATDQALP